MEIRLLEVGAPIVAPARRDGGEHKVRPYAPPNVGANLVFAHYAQKLRLHRVILFISRSALQMDRVLRVLY